ncbi:MAG: protein kinase [Planctomycetes bacterium]|nr:protein kinase [Planctomycetota bacterium]
MLPPPPGDRKAFSATLPAEAFAHGGIPIAPDRFDPTADRDDRPHLRGTALARHLAPLADEARGAAHDGERFQLIELLGNGATGLVYSAHDQNLARDIAVKVLKSASDEDVHSFVDEARTTAGLDHPNVLPVHEIDVTESGQVYFTMKKIEGRSLGEAILSSTSARRDEILATGRLVSIAIALGQALGYAHHRGIIHQDIKPDNVMLGAYGEIILVDWGSATRVDAPQQRLYGTPLYMAPEQARLERVDARADIYCLGATLFHALMLRVPTWSDDPEEFWRRKRAGEFDQPTALERSNVPPPLLDIALKAISARPDDRYQRAEDLVRDLERYQNGLSVLAHRDSWLESFARWHGRHARVLWIASASLLAIAILAAVLYGERLKQLATWGKPIIVEDFADDGWKERWTVGTGGFDRRDGMMVNTAGWDSMLDLKQRLEADTALEFTGEVPPGSDPGDLSVFWYEDQVARRGDDNAGLYKFQVGAFGNQYSAITGQGATHYGYSDFRIEVGRRYRIRAEIQGAAIRLIIDGRTICEYIERRPFHGGHFSIYYFFPGHTLRDIRIYAREVAQQVPATAVGEAFLRNGLPAPAAVEFRRVAASHPGTAIAREAVFQQGLCLLVENDSDQGMRAADELWSTLRGSEWDEEIALQHLEHRFNHGSRTEVADDLARLYRATKTGPARDRLVVAWTHFIAQVIIDVKRHWNGPLLERYLDVHDELFPGSPIADRATCEGLLSDGRYQEILDRYPKQVSIGSTALIWAGRPEEVPIRYPDVRTIVIDALNFMGRFDEISQRYPDQDMVDISPVHRGCAAALLAKEPHSAKARCALGRLDEVLADPQTKPDGRRIALLLLGRPGEVDDPDQKNSPDVLLAMGQIDEAMALHGANFQNGCWVRHAAGLDAFIAGDRERAWPLFAVTPREEFHQNGFSVLHYVVAPFLHELAGERGAMAAACEDISKRGRYIYQQQPWYHLNYLLGRIDEPEFLAQPLRFFAPACLAFCKGIRSELDGDSQSALAAYRSYLAMPRYLRGESFEATCERFAQWRADQLEHPDGR